jgi:hypothetical protein
MSKENQQANEQKDDNIKCPPQSPSLANYSAFIIKEKQRNYSATPIFFASFLHKSLARE